MTKSREAFILKEKEDVLQLFENILFSSLKNRCILRKKGFFQIDLAKQMVSPYNKQDGIYQNTIGITGELTDVSDCSEKAFE